MLEKLVAELKTIVAEIKSPFSYIHDKLVESMAAVHAEVEALKSKIEALEVHVSINTPVAPEVPKIDPNAGAPVAQRAPVEVKAAQKTKSEEAKPEEAKPITPQYYMEDGAGDKVIATSEDLSNLDLVHAKVFVKHPDGSFSEVERV